MKIYNLGSLNIDYVYQVEHFVRPGETLSSSCLKLFPGGKGLNQSVALAKAGAQVIHCGIAGEGSALLTSTLKDAGVDISRIRLYDEPNGHAIIQVDSTGQNCILLFAGTNHKFDAEYIEKALSGAEKNDLLLIQNETNALDLIIEAAHRKGMQIAFNPSPFDPSVMKLPLEYVDWWLCNEIESAQLCSETSPEDAAAALLKRFPGSNVLVTLGKDGAIFKNREVSVRQPIFPVKAVDTTAAGDTFTGYFLSAVTTGKTPAEALKIASAASAIAVSRAGAASSVPTADEVAEFLKARK